MATRNDKDKALKECDHKIDPKSIKYDPKYGRRGVCIKCGVKLYMSRDSRTGLRERPGKKERKRRKKIKVAILKAKQQDAIK